MTKTVRTFLLVEAVTFALASLVHGGFLIAGYEHRQARIAEAVIASVLVVGLVVPWIRPGLTRVAGIAAQTFALLLTLVGVSTIVIGIGPRTIPDVVYHVAIVGVLIYGLVSASRAPGGPEPASRG